jgi:hypothetical protein
MNLGTIQDALQTERQRLKALRDGFPDPPNFQQKEDYDDLKRAVVALEQQETQLLISANTAAGM